MQTSKCWIYKGELEQKLNTTSGPELAFMLSRIISELLDNFQAEEEDLNHARSNLDWADVSALRIILKVKEAALQAHHLDRFLELETARTHWSQLTTILNYAVFTSEILLNCWGENENLTLYMSQLEDPFFSVPFTVVVPRTHLMQFVSGLESVQECLTQRGFEKLNEKSREILSLVSLKVSLLTIACLIYPIVLVSFKQMTEWIQNYARSLRERTEDLKRERHLAEELLHQMLPKYVAKQLRKHKHVEAESYDQVRPYYVNGQ
ncbi:hypothetical protein NDU88_011603 [Pleurodeles waltl]|uniref:guanylate cyclase n=1 Tax=Pleurodeles waltl TaxID=8319 RepID=A0AAV7QZK9_PLEWA|nr:hypothetical protein NDU88_011603 [Pleurodeles waltl]